MAIVTITQPAAEAILASVPFDHRTTGGLPLPNFGNSGRLDIERLRAALIMIDGLVAGVPASIDARFDALVGAAPAALDTLTEIAEALHNNPDVIDEILTALGLRATKSELTTAVTTLQGLIGEKADASSLNAKLDKTSKASGAQLRALTDDAVYVTPKSNADAMAFVTAAATATIAPDFGAGFNRLYTMGLNATLGQPTNMKDGLPVIIYFVQDATGGRTLSFSATYHKFPGGIVPTLSTAANAIDRLAGICRNRAGTIVVEWGTLEVDIK